MIGTRRERGKDFNGPRTWCLPRDGRRPKKRRKKRRNDKHLVGGCFFFPTGPIYDARACVRIDQNAFIACFFIITSVLLKLSKTLCGHTQPPSSPAARTNQIDTTTTTHTRIHHPSTRRAHVCVCHKGGLLLLLAARALLVVAAAARTASTTGPSTVAARTLCEWGVASLVTTRYVNFRHDVPSIKSIHPRPFLNPFPPTHSGRRATGAST